MWEEKETDARNKTYVETAYEVENVKTPKMCVVFTILSI